MAHAAHLEASEEAAGERVGAALEHVDALRAEREQRVARRVEHLLVHHAVAPVDAGVAAPRIDANLARGGAAVGVEGQLARHEREAAPHGVEPSAEREGDLRGGGVEHEPERLGRGGSNERQREREECGESYSRITNSLVTNHLVPTNR